MTLPRDTMMDLMAYADGELDADTRARVEQLLATSAEARSVTEALGVLSDEVQTAVLVRAMPRADGLADLVMARLEGGHAAGAGVPTHGAGVVPIGSARPVRTRAVVAVAVASVFALAAGYAVLVRTAVDKLSDPTLAPAPVASGAASEGDGQGVEVAQLDSPDRSVAVMYLPAVAAAANANASTVVIWIADEQASGDQ